MKNRLWIVFLALSIAFAGAAAYLFISYQNQSVDADTTIDYLRNIRNSAQMETKDTNEITMPTAQAVSVSEEYETEVFETPIPADYDGFEEEEIDQQTTADSNEQQLTLTAAQPIGDGETKEPETTEGSVILQSPAPVSADDIPIDELLIPSATATAEIKYSLNTVVPSGDDEPMPTNWVSKPKYELDKKDILPEYKELYEINHELIGWLTIEGTKIDYPVVQTETPDFYLKHDFYGNSNANGMLIVTPEYDVLTPSQNILIHGHNMRNGKMFNDLQKYAVKSFFEKHQYIRFDTLTEHRDYQVVSAFYTRIYEADEPGFRYNVILGDDVEVTKYFVTGIRKNAAYDTGVKFDRYDEYLELSTCAYHAREGRFVVIAKRVYP